MRRILLAVFPVVAAIVAGCTAKPPTSAGGKPVSHWVSLMDSPDAHHRSEAVEKLGNVGAADPAARPAVLRALRDKDAKVRREAVRAIAKFGPPDAEATAALADLKAHDPDAQVRTFAARVLDPAATGPNP